MEEKIKYLGRGPYRKKLLEKNEKQPLYKKYKCNWKTAEPEFRSDNFPITSGSISRGFPKSEISESG